MISVEKASQIVNYLANLGFILNSAGQAAAWADYLNSEASGADWASEALFEEAARRVARRHDPAKRFTAESLAAEVRRVGSDRLRRAGQPDRLPGDVASLSGWWKVFNTRVKQGLSRQDALVEAYRAIGEAPPPPPRVGSPPTRELKNLIASLSEVKRISK